MSVNYIVAIDLQVNGQLASHLQGAHDKAKALDSGVNRLKSSFSDAVGRAHALISPLENAVGRAIDFSVSMAKWGTFAGIATVTLGVTSLNKELENTQITLATIFSAQKVTSSIDAGMGLAAATMAQMRKDAAALPGEFDDLRRIFMTIATPAFNMGMAPNALRAMASQTMAVGAVFGIRSDQTAREMAMLLEGRAGAHNILGMRLGFMGSKAHELKTATAEKRVAMISGELTKYAPSIEKFQSSFEGITTTTTSNIKLAEAIVTGPLFEGVKRTFSSINDWYDKNQLKVTVFAQALGSKLSDAWEWGVKKVDEWGPIVWQFAQNAYTYLSGIWVQVEPYIERVAGYVKEMFRDPGTFDKITHILELYAGLRIASAAGGLGASVIGVAGGAANVVSAAKTMGWLGAGAKVAGAGAVGAEAAVATTGFAGAVAGAGGGMAGLVAVSVPVAGALASVGMAAWQAYGLYSDISNDMNATALAQYEAGMRAVRAMDNNANEYDFATTMVSRLRAAGEDTTARMLEVSIATQDATNAARHLAAGLDDIGDRVPQAVEATLHAVKEHRLMELPGFGESSAAKKPPAHPGGAHGVHINQVQIAVTQNGDPSRVAYAVADIFSNWRRHRRSSPDVPSWARSEVMG